jgi:hypothetical protein
MVFVLDRNGQEMVSSGTIPAYLNRSQIIGGINADVYRSTWSWQVPAAGDVEGLYHLNLIIHCGWKEGGVQSKSLAFGNSHVLGRISSSPAPAPSGIEGFINFILGLLGRIQASPTPTPMVPFQPPFPAIIRSSDKTLQPGTFLPVPTLPTGGCKDLYFQVLGAGYF